MGRFFNMDSGLFRFLSRLADLMILNILFLLTCIPIVTIGASCTALYYVTMKMARDEDAYIAPSYFKSFKENFKQATIIWVVALLLIVLLFFDFQILSVMTASFVTVIRIALISVSLVMAMVLLYTFPVLAKFYNSIKNTVKNAFFMSIRHFPKTLLMLVISVGAVVLTFLSAFTLTWGILIWMMFGFALISYLHARFFVKIFDMYISENQEEEVEKTEEDYHVESGVFQNIGTPLKRDENGNLVPVEAEEQTDTETEKDASRIEGEEV